MSIRNIRIFILLIILSSLLGYLEWGGGNRAFLFEMEREVILKMIVSPKSVIHPLTILPILGQLLLIISLWGVSISKKFVYWGIGLIGILFLMILFIGIISFNWKIIVFTLPFLIFSGLFYFKDRK